MPTFHTGQAVKVLPPFAASFPGERIVVEPPARPEDHDDVTDGPWPPEGCYWLEGIEAGFSDIYLESAE